MEASPSPVYGARLLSGFGLIPIASSNLAASARGEGPSTLGWGAFTQLDPGSRSGLSGIGCWEQDKARTRWERFRHFSTRSPVSTSRPSMRGSKPQAWTLTQGRPPTMAEPKTHTRNPVRSLCVGCSRHGAGSVDWEYCPPDSQALLEARAGGDEPRRARFPEQAGLGAFGRLRAAGTIAAAMGNDRSVHCMTRATGSGACWALGRSRRQAISSRRTARAATGCTGRFS